MPSDKFDCTKPAEVEAMNDTDFGTWKSGKLSEVATYVTGSLAPPGRTLIILAIDAYVNTGNTLRQVADLRVSNHQRGLTADKKTEILKQLRVQFENGRKLFNFACVNASKFFQTRNFLLNNRIFLIRQWPHRSLQGG